MGAAQGLLDHLVDQLELKQVLRRELQASAAAGACSALRHRMAAQPSGEITE